MEIITLPDDLQIENSLSPSVFDYYTSQECLNQRISLRLNTFSFLLEGSKEVITNKASISIQNSDFLIMKSGHCLMTEILSSSNNHYRSILFFFSNDRLFNFLKDHKVNYSKTHDSKSVRAFKYDSFIKTFVASLADISQLDSTVKRKLLNVKFDELMLYLIETKGTDFIYDLTLAADDQSENFIHVVERNKLNRLTLKELAFLSNMSVSTFKREFQKHFDAPPIKWFHDRRLDHSAFLLKNKSKRPSDIYEEVGYESLSNFVHAFKTKFGITPKQYQLD